MSTRAIICLEAENEPSYSIYCHGDGYPEYLGRLLIGIVARLAQMDPNQPVRERNGNYWVPNASYLPEKAICVVIGELWKMGYRQTYITERDPEEEAGKGWTDIEHLYVVKLPKYLTKGKPELTWYSLTSEENRQCYIKHSNEEFYRAIREAIWSML